MPDPAPRTACPAGSNYVAIAAGENHSLSLRSDGTLVGWGDNEYGQTDCPAGEYELMAAGVTHNVAIEAVPEAGVAALLLLGLVAAWRRGKQALTLDA